MREGPSERDPETVELLFDTVRRQVNPEPRPAPPHRHPVGVHRPRRPHVAPDASTTAPPPSAEGAAPDRRRAPARRLPGLRRHHRRPPHPGARARHRPHAPARQPARAASGSPKSSRGPEGVRGRTASPYGQWGPRTRPWAIPGRTPVPRGSEDPLGAGGAAAFFARIRTAATVLARGRACGHRRGLAAKSCEPAARRAVRGRTRAGRAWRMRALRSRGARCSARCHAWSCGRAFRPAPAELRRARQPTARAPADLRSPHRGLREVGAVVASKLPRGEAATGRHRRPRSRRSAPARSPPPASRPPSRPAASPPRRRPRPRRPRPRRRPRRSPLEAAPVPAPALGSRTSLRASLPPWRHALALTPALAPAPRRVDGWGVGRGCGSQPQPPRQRQRRQHGGEAAQREDVGAARRALALVQRARGGSARPRGSRMPKAKPRISEPCCSHHSPPRIASSSSPTLPATPRPARAAALHQLASCAPR